MYLDIFNKLPKDFESYQIEKVESGASKKKIFRLKNNLKSLIVIDFVNDINEYNNHIKIYSLLEKINISVPRIIFKDGKNLIILTEDFGNLRFDYILKKYPLKNLLQYSVDTLIIIKNKISYDTSIKMPQYNFNVFKGEISELSDYYFPSIGINNKNILHEFFYIWEKFYLSFEFYFDSFVHKDFNINNLILIPDNKNHLKCGIIDFQSAFWGDSSWDLFSLLEDSRILFPDKYNKYFIDYFYKNTKQKDSLELFKKKFYFLNASRQTRLLGRWIKLANDLDKAFYLDFINTTKTRLRKSLSILNNYEINQFYNKYVFNK